jgi:hypothetical protein
VASAKVRGKLKPRFATHSRGFTKLQIKRTGKKCERKEGNKGMEGKKKWHGETVIK